MIQIMTSTLHSSRNNGEDNSNICCLQANIPEGGARLILASGPFWDIVTPAQDINNVRKCAARDAPVKLQAGAVKQGLKVDPTLLVVDLAPPTSPAGLIDLQKLCKQVSPACCSLVMMGTLSKRHQGCCQ